MSRGAADDQSLSSPWAVRVRGASHASVRAPPSGFAPEIWQVSKTTGTPQYIQIVAGHTDLKVCELPPTPPPPSPKEVRDAKGFCLGS